MKGITSQFLLPVGALVILLSGFVLYRTYATTRTHLNELMDQQAALALEFDLAIRKYVADEIRPRAEQSAAPGEFVPETMSTSFVARSVFEHVRREFPDYIIKFSSDNPRNPANQATPDELRMIAYFNANPDVDRWKGIVELDGKEYFAQFRARRMKESCVRCHGDPADAPASLVERYGPIAGFHRPVGEVVALDTIAIPMDSATAALSSGLAEKSAILIGGLLLFFGAIVLVFRLVVIRRLAAMGAHFEQITAQPDSAQIATINVGGHDEISVLAGSFNVLTVRLRAAYASLECRVAERTKELANTTAELKRSEQELRKAHATAKQVLEAFTSVLIGVNADNRVTVWNVTAAHLFGIEAKIVMGQLFDDLGFEWDHAVIARAMSECRAERRRVRIEEMRFTHRDGTVGYLGLTLAPLDTGADGGVGVLLVAKDITEQRIFQSQLTQAQKLESIGQLAAGIAHEINTPTQFVGDNTRFLKDAFQDLQGLLAKYVQLAEADRSGSATSEILAVIDAAEKKLDRDYLLEEIPQAIMQSLEGIERVSQIVRAMKDFSHPGGRGKEAVDLNQAIESTVTVTRSEWKYVAEMVMDFDPALPRVPGLAGDFNQVILNIVINAAHAIAGVVDEDSGEKGTITIATRRDGDWAEIRISDTGTGISAEHRSKVFDHFFTTKEVGKGTGQGLAIAHAVVTEKHGGSLTFETKMGVGTTFIIRLPIEASCLAEIGCAP